MLESFFHYLETHQAGAPWVVFIAILLAGVNVPISIDLVLVFCAFLAASVIPESTYPLYFSILIGSAISAWVAYWLGRLFGRKLLKTKLLSKLISSKRLQKVENYYQKYGLLTLIVGRFIPFGVRNCIFITTGISRMKFWKFACADFLGCAAWSSLMFISFYHLGKNFETLKYHLKWLNICLFLAFSVTVITIIWYKIRKNQSSI